MGPESSEGQALEKEVRIEARPETVFPFFTDPAKMTRWKGRSATLDPRPGGTYRVDVNGRWSRTRGWCSHGVGRATGARCRLAPAP